MIAGLGCIVRQTAALLANHLWQSTLFGLAAACVAVSIRRNEARVRFWVWFLASGKFLFPFTLLVHAGSLLSRRGTGISQRTFASVVEIVSQPFGQPAPHVILETMWWDRFSGVVPVFIAALWITGTSIVLLKWCLQWFQVSRMKTTATPLGGGVEVDFLYSLTATMGTKPLPIFLIKGHHEPGIFGVFQSILLWPETLSNQLDAPQLKTVLAHEVWHVRRRDNLTAAVQMFIEAIFWFHPMVWWFGSRQMHERELACDEGVLGLGGDPAAYAEGILKACRFYIKSPLACAAGVSGSDLNKKIERIMKVQDITVLSTSRKVVLSFLSIAAITAPLLTGAAIYPRAFAQGAAAESSSGPVRVTVLKRNNAGAGAPTLIRHTVDGTAITNTTVRNLIELAYSMKSYQLTGGPSWVDQDRFDISFTGGEPSGNAQNLVSGAALKQILSQQFQLVLRQETKPGPVLALVVDNGGAKFPAVTPQKAPGTDEPLLSIRAMVKDGQGRITILGDPSGLADFLSGQIGRPITDNTGLTGTYNIDFHWAAASASAESISADLQQQLGLSLVPREGSVETSVIASVSAPAGS